MARITRYEEFYTETETNFFTKCLELLGIDFTRDDWYLAEDTKMHCHRIDYKATDEEFNAIVKMFLASKDMKKVTGSKAF